LKVLTFCSKQNQKSQRLQSEHSQLNMALRFNKLVGPRFTRQRTAAELRHWPSNHGCVQVTTLER
jgi:hypothetical protein